MVAEGWRGWDDYAPFYDWENARTVARRDVAFWCRLASAQEGPVLELGCGTGRIAVPVAKAGVRLVGRGEGLADDEALQDGGHGPSEPWPASRTREDGPVRRKDRVRSSGV